MTFPPPPPKIPRTALPAGTWVTGKNVLGTFGLIGHKGHLFVVMSPPRRAAVEFSNSGYRQDARCLVCRTDISDVDGEFLQVRATEDDVEACLVLVEDLLTKGQGAKRALQKGLVPW